MILTSSDYFFRRLLAMGPFERRRGGWRFGTRRIAEHIAIRMVDLGLAAVDGDRLVALAEPIRPWRRRV